MVKGKGAVNASLQRPGLSRRRPNQCRIILVVLACVVCSLTLYTRKIPTTSNGISLGRWKRRFGVANWQRIKEGFTLQMHEEKIVLVQKRPEPWPPLSQDKKRSGVKSSLQEPSSFDNGKNLDGHFHEFGFPPPVVVGVQQFISLPQGNLNVLGVPALQASDAPAPQAGNERGYPEFDVSLDEEARLWNEISNPSEDWRRELLDELRDAKKIIKGEIPTPDPVGPDEPKGEVYHNASLFRRSYREMEKRMRIFIYPEGRPPLMHTGPRYGIYASEGFVIRVLKPNMPMVTPDPKKANVFFLPFSVGNSVKVLAFKSDGTRRCRRYNARMKANFTDYMQRIYTRRPFFNLSRASDHFYVACHDWGAKTARFHPLLYRNAIKVVCNADERSGDYVHGRDAGYLEIKVRRGKYPDKVGGIKHLRERTVLAFFAGQRVGQVRPKLLDEWGGGRDHAIQVFQRLNTTQLKKMPYAQRMRNARFCLCPAGFEVNSPRIVEAMVYECIPVIIADGFSLPFSDVLRWESFSILLPEADIPRLKEILLKVTDRQVVKFQERLRYVRRHFVFQTPPRRYDAYHMALHSVWLRRLASVDGPPPWNRTLEDLKL